jgi:hypothetical protein
MSVPGGGMSRTTQQLYRDCLRLVSHVAGKSKKGDQLRLIVGKEFRKNAAVADPLAIEALKSNGVRALANYLMMESTTRDDKFKNQVAKFTSKEAESIKK